MTVKSYELLDSLPVYGPMYVWVTHDGSPFYSEGVAIRFFRSDGNDWVANFHPGSSQLTTVIELPESINLLVIAKGTCYLMNPDETTPVETFGVSYSSVFPASKKRYVLADQTDLTIIEPDGSHWHSPRISWDGLNISDIDQTFVSGVAYDPMFDSDEWVEFSFDIDTKELIGGSYNRYQDRRPWWTFW